MNSIFQSGNRHGKAGAFKFADTYKGRQFGGVHFPCLPTGL